MTAPTAQTTIEDWERIINVNLWGYIYTINAVMVFFQDVVQELLRFSTGKNDYYRLGMRAASLIQSAL